MRLNVTVFAAVLRQLRYQNNTSRRAIITLQIPPQRITDDSV